MLRSPRKVVGISQSSGARAPHTGAPRRANDRSAQSSKAFSSCKNPRAISFTADGLEHSVPYEASFKPLELSMSEAALAAEENYSTNCKPTAGGKRAARCTMPR